MLFKTWLYLQGNFVFLYSLSRCCLQVGLWQILLHSCLSWLCRDWYFYFKTRLFICLLVILQDQKLKSFNSKFCIPDLVSLRHSKSKFDNLVFDFVFCFCLITRNRQHYLPYIVTYLYRSYMKIFIYSKNINALYCWYWFDCDRKIMAAKLWKTKLIINLLNRPSVK